MEAPLIGIDWGTSRLRAFRIGLDGQILERRASDRGIAAISDGHFDQALRAIIEGWPSGTPILMCGMVGSRQGWQETPYQSCPADANELARTLYPIETSYGPAWIVGGVCTGDDRNAGQERAARKLYDVMRGEETQIVGVASPDGPALIITPGTHSKWAVVRAARIESFRTYMTGEIYALLEKHSILGRLMQSGQDPQDQEASFLDGVHLGFEEPGLLHSLFSVRTQGLFEQRAPATLTSYLSGILIGSEVSTEARRRTVDGSVIIIASHELGRLYQIALSAAGLSDVQLLDAETAVVAGLLKIWRLRGRAA